MTFFTTQSTLGSRHEALFQIVTLTFGGALAVTLTFTSLATFATVSTLASFTLALVGRAVAVCRVEERVVPPVVLVAIFCREVLFFPGVLRVAALVASPGPRMTQRVVSVRGRCEHVPSEFVDVGPGTLWSHGVGPHPKVCRKIGVQLLESF